MKRPSVGWAPAGEERKVNFRLFTESMSIRKLRPDGNRVEEQSAVRILLLEADLRAAKTRRAGPVTGFRADGKL